MSLNKVHNERVRPLLDKVDKLRVDFAGEPIHFPTIVAIGERGSGKSSVLESLSGINLPRGQNVVTRCPLVLRLVNTSNDEREYAEIDSRKVGKRQITLDKIEENINAYTQNIAGKGQSVSSDPIDLTVYKHRCPDLTLIDLPGITRVAVGNEPKDIYNQIKALMQQYIAPEESIMLCVIPATQDVTTIEAIQLARAVDPEGKRTIGVFTKIDCCEKGIRDRLEARGSNNLALKLGYIAVRNRTQKEIEQGMSFEEARKLEEDFFRQHNELKYMPSEYLGTEQLARKLAQIQESCVRAILPTLHAAVSKRLEDNSTEIDALEIPPTNSEEYRLWFGTRVNNLVSNINSLIKTGSNKDNNKALNVVARLREEYANFFDAITSNTKDFLGSSYGERVADAMREHGGVGLSNFLSHPAFEHLLRMETSKLYAPANALIMAVFHRHRTMLELLIKEQFYACPKLVSHVTHCVCQFLEKGRKRSHDLIRQIIKNECEDVFTCNQSYIDTVKAIQRLIEDCASNEQKSDVDITMCNILGEIVNLSALSQTSTNMHVSSAHEMQIDIYAYWRVVYCRIGDQIPMTLRACFDRNLCSNLHGHLNEAFRDVNVLEEALQDNFQGVIEKRESLLKSNLRLESALYELNCL